MVRPRARSFGKKPNLVRVFQPSPGRNIHLSWYDHSKKYKVRRSLGHRDWELAAQQGQQWSLGLQKEEAHQDGILHHGDLTYARLFSHYERHRTPQKGKAAQTADKRRTEMSARWFGGTKDPHDISLRDWEGFIEARGSGEINDKGLRVPTEEQREVGDRTVEADLRWLNAVFNWAARWRLPEGGYLMRENAARGFPVPKEKNPEQAAITQEQHEALLAVADQVTIRVALNGKWETIPTYLRHLLVIAEGTGRRASSICGLTWQDVHLKEKENCPDGWINWPAETDKEGFVWNDVPISPEVRQAFDEIQTERPGIGATPLFPSPKDPTKPITKDTANKWFRRAEAIAAREFGIEPMPHNRTVHGFRAKFAIETQHLPDKLRCALGGWKSDMTLRTVYDKPTAGGMLEVLRERKREPRKERKTG